MIAVVQTDPPRPHPCPPLLGLEDEIAAISAALREGLLTGLRSSLEAARAEWPRDLRLRLLEGEWHERSGRLQEAEACFRDVLRDHSDNPWPAVRLLNLLVSMGRVSDAHAIFADHV